jgi:hypothetical protein
MNIAPDACTENINAVSIEMKPLGDVSSAKSKDVGTQNPKRKTKIKSTENEMTCF